MSYAEKRAKKLPKAIDYAKVPFFIYKGKDPSYKRNLRSGHVYYFLPKVPQSVMNLMDLQDMLDVADSSKNLFDVGMGFARISQKAYNNITDVLSEGVELMKTRGYYEKEIKTLAAGELKAKLEKEKAKEVKK